MSKKISITLSSLIMSVIPFVTYAEYAVTGKKDLGYVITIIIGYLNQFLILLIGLAVVIFIWNVIKYFIRSDEERKNAAPYVMYSLIGFFVILSFWGLVNILQNTFGLQNESNQPASWTSFKGIFPAGGISSPTSANPVINPTGGSSFNNSGQPGSSITNSGPTGSSINNSGQQTNPPAQINNIIPQNSGPVGNTVPPAQ